MSILKWFLGLSGALCLVTALLVISIELVGFNIKFHEREYTKMQVDKALDMQMDDILEVRVEILKYLKGNRDDLVIPTNIGGERREFFNDREKQHMVDVLNLFHLAFFIRNISIIICFLFFLLLLWIREKQIVYKSIFIMTGLVLVATACLGILIATNFTKYFTVFHLLFFSNDLWLLNPETDLLIRLVPEQFFADAAFYTAVIFLLSNSVLFIGSAILSRQKRRIFIR